VFPPALSNLKTVARSGGGGLFGDLGLDLTLDALGGQ
jgi:hypothetical protein